MYADSLYHHLPLLCKLGVKIGQKYGPQYIAGCFKKAFIYNVV
jgi:hypothetical protein